MDKLHFQNLPAECRLAVFRHRLGIAESCTEIFGHTNPKEAYRHLVHEVHPDRVDLPNRDMATAVTALLNEARDLPEFDSRIIDGVTTTARLGKGDIADVYRGEDSDGKGFIVKVCRDKAEDDLMLHEFEVLTDFAAMQGKEEAFRYLPRPGLSTDRFGPRINILHLEPDYHPDPRELYSLAECALFYPDGKIPEKHIGWIWRRLMALFSFTHYFGYIHGAITPDNILIEPISHGVVVIDWIHTSIDQTVIGSISREWKDNYPIEVLNKDLPHPSTDIYMAAKAMKWANPAMSEPMKKYFDWCSQVESRMRPENTNILLSEWDRVMYEKLGWQKKFVEMPEVGFQWFWWW